MTRVNPVNEKTTCVKPLSQGIGIGAACGLAMKYLYPVTADEKASPSYRVHMAKFNQEVKQYTPETEEFLAEIKQKPNRTLVEDVFVRSFDGMKYGEKISPKVYDTAMEGIKNNGQGDIAEMKNLFKELKLHAKLSRYKYVNLLNTLTRHERPTAFFLATGAVVGAFAGVTNYVIKQCSNKVS